MCLDERCCRQKFQRVPGLGDDLGQHTFVRPADADLRGARGACQFLGDRVERLPVVGGAGRRDQGRGRAPMASGNSAANTNLRFRTAKRTTPAIATATIQRAWAVLTPSPTVS